LAALSCRPSSGCTSRGPPRLEAEVSSSFRGSSRQEPSSESTEQARGSSSPHMPVDEQAQRLVDLPIIPNGWGWAATGVGPDFAVLLLAADTPFDARRAGRTTRYRLYRRTVGSFDVFEFQHEGAAYTHVQPIGDGNSLLVTPGIYEAMRDKRNGNVWNSAGRLIGKILLGDGINNVPTSVRSEGWVG